MGADRNRSWPKIVAVVVLVVFVVLAVVGRLTGNNDEAPASAAIHDDHPHTQGGDHFRPGKRQGTDEADPNTADRLAR
jgi:hypothetical protein